MLITVFTPTYNRSHTLARTYHSLIRQSFKDFEWLIIDDGSTDDTEKVVNKFIEEDIIDIKYIKKKNGGKHTAYNLALEKAKGVFFFTVDSDDWLPKNSLDDISSIAVRISDEDSIGGIIALKTTSDGSIIGKPFLQENVYSTFRELELSGQAGERSIIFKTGIARKFPFPTINGEHFMPECVVYDKYNYNYKFITSNRSLTTCEYQTNGLSSNPRQLMTKAPGGYFLYYRNRIDMAVTIRERIGYIVRYNMFKRLYNGSEISSYRGRFRLLCSVLNVLTPFVFRYYLAHLK